MKTLVLIACLLGMVYASNPEVVKRFHANIAACAQELNKPPSELETIFCSLRKQGTLDNQNRYIIEKGIASLDDLISDQAKRNQGKETLRKCYEQLQYQENNLKHNEEETAKGIQCGSIVLTFIDKP